MANQSFAAQVAAFAEMAKERIDQVVKESAQEVVRQMQTEGPSMASTADAISKGAGLGKVKANGERGNLKKAVGPVNMRGFGAAGNMPVDTGFLRSSLHASTTAMPVIDSSAVPKEGQTYNYDAGEVEAIIAGAEPGATLYFGYVAAYARVAEYGGENRAPRAFVRSAAQNWQQIVEQKAAEAQAKDKGK